VTAADTNVETRRATRQLIQPDVPDFDAASLDAANRDALVGLLLSMADDEFIVGFRDSEWTGIAPMLEEDVAFSSLSQDEIGHARTWYEMASRFVPETADQLAFRTSPELYSHARLLDHPRTDWAFTITRRWLYDTADAIRLEALATSSFAPLAEVVAKVRREERYHLMHLDSWMRRLAASRGKPRDSVSAALDTLAADALTVFTPLPNEALLLEDGILAQPTVGLAERWLSEVNGVLGTVDLPTIPQHRPPADGRSHTPPAESFVSLWREFTSVAFLEEGAEW
jgi:ring-1,2-phenylacetyl-CoA epoxidase subunit PaaC